MSALRFRLVTAGAVAAALAAFYVAWPEGEARAHAQVCFVLTLGYGHLLGAVLARRRRGSAAARAFGWTSAAVGLALYAEVVTRWPGAVAVLLALSAWHIAENDAALARALARGEALGPLRAAQSVPLGAAALAGAGAPLAPHAAELLADLFFAATLHHLVGWLVFLVVRGARWRRLVLLHAPAIGLAALLLALPGDAAAALRAWLFSPALYLYGSALHVVQTALARRRAAT